MAELARFYDQKLAWRDCGGGFQCTTLTVPLDYSKPQGRTIDVAVIRKPATGTRIGSLIVNPGGPGASGVDYVRGSAKTFSHLTDEFDLVSFDPRGVGASSPVRCFTSQQIDAYIHEDPSPDTPAERTTIVDAARHYADSCWQRNGDLLAHIGTIDAARDMDVLRAALGDAKLTYYGASYGTYLGAKYAQQFPTRIRAMVLDGAVDPTEPAQDSNTVQAAGFETDLRDFLAWCARQGCSLGSTESDAEQGLDRLSQQIDAHPEPVGSRSLGPGEFWAGLALGMYSTSFWQYLQQGLQDAQQGNGALMLRLSDILNERHDDGSYSNLGEAFISIECIDRPWPQSVQAYEDAAARAKQTSPHFGEENVLGSLPCAFWHVPPVETNHAVTAQGAPPIVVIGTTRDPATPYAWAQSLARQLSSGVLVTYDSDGHTAYDSGNTCILGAVDPYLESGQPPRAGVRCG